MSYRVQPPSGPSASLGEGPAGTRRNSSRLVAPSPTRGEELRPPPGWTLRDGPPGVSRAIWRPGIGHSSSDDSGPDSDDGDNVDVRACNLYHWRKIVASDQDLATALPEHAKRDAEDQERVDDRQEGRDYAWHRLRVELGPPSDRGRAPLIAAVQRGYYEARVACLDAVYVAWSDAAAAAWAVERALRVVCRLLLRVARSCWRSALRPAARSPYADQARRWYWSLMRSQAVQFRFARGNSWVNASWGGFDIRDGPEEGRPGDSAVLARFGYTAAAAVVQLSCPDGIGDWYHKGRYRCPAPMCHDPVPDIVLEGVAERIGAALWPRQPPFTMLNRAWRIRWAFAELALATRGRDRVRPRDMVWEGDRALRQLYMSLEPPALRERRRRVLRPGASYRPGTVFCHAVGEVATLVLHACSA